MKVNYEVIFLFHYLHLNVSVIQTGNLYQAISNNNTEIPSEHTKTAVCKHMLGICFFTQDTVICLKEALCFYKNCEQLLF